MNALERKQLLRRLAIQLGHAPKPSSLRGPFKTDPVKLPSKPSQTLLDHLDHCGYAGYLYLKHGGGTGSHAMHRGSAFHEFAERATRRILERAGGIDSEALERAQEMAVDEAQLREWLEEAGVGASRIDPDEARTLMQEVIAEHPEWNVPAGEQESLRAMAWNFATGHMVDPAHIVAVETMIELEIGGWTIRGKLDRAEVADRLGYVHDYKSSRAIPSVERFEEKFQPPFYALLLAFGVYAEPDERSTQEGIHPSQYGQRVAKGLSAVHTYEHYPRFTYEETGELVNRANLFTHADLADFAEGVKALLKKLEHGLEHDEWEATPSSHCDICPAQHECPISPEARGVEKPPANEAEAVAIGEDIILLEKVMRRKKSTLRAYVEANGHLIVGDFEYGLAKRESRQVKDADKLEKALKEGGADADAHLRRTVSTRFDKKRLAA